MRSPRIWLGASITVGTALVAWSTLRPLLARVGHPGATLDDAYIHFQYARAYAEGHPLRFQAGEPRSSGGTSFVWPAVLAVFYLAGLHGESIVGAAWALSFVALGGLAWEASALTRRLTGSETAAFFAAALVVAFSPFAWFAASGMEVVPFAWTLARLARLTAEEADDNADPAAAPAAATDRPRGRRVQIVAFAWLAPLVRPEGAALTLLAALVLLTGDRRSRLAARLLLAAPVAAGAVLPNVLLFATTGQLTSSTAQVKLLSGDPYLHGARAWMDAVASNVVVAVTDLLDGGLYSSEFLPAHGAFLLLTGLAAIAVCSRLPARRARAHAWMVLGLAALLFVPCTYVTFLWNRLRYLWPFATGWIVGVACLAALVAQTVVRLLPVDLRWPRLEPVLTATLLSVALFLVARHLPVAIADVADSASGIDRQQASLGRWVKANVPADERVGVNDTGAIAYFGEHRTFDIVGLTSPLEGKYWVAGPASRFEHYEDLAGSAAGGRLPGFWAVYPNWFGLPSLLGEPLATREVRASILGGVVMSVFRSNGAALGSGARPWSLAPSSRVVDEVDVASVDSEEVHFYALLDATLGDEVMGVTTLDNGLTVVDGGRGRRTVESFAVNLAASPGDGEGCTGILRYASDAPFALAVGTASFSVPAAELDEVTYPVPAARCGDRHAPLELRFSHPIAVFHHWFTRPYAK